MFSVVAVQDQTGDPAFDLTTVADVQAELGISDDDANIQAQISFYSKVIASFCDRVFASEFVVETFYLGWGECLSALPLSRYPVADIYSVTTNGGEIAASNYVVDPVSGMLHRLCGQWHGQQIAVTYVGGYDLPGEAPAPLAQACIEFVRDKRLTQGRDPTIAEISDDGSSVRYWVPDKTTGNQALPPGVADLIAPFRRLTI